MSVVERLGGDRPTIAGLRALRPRLARAVFGDALGVVVFLSTVLVAFACLRVGFFITDSYTVANTLVGVSRGHLWVPPEVVYGDSPDTPGMHLVDGRLYGRNYGQVFLALPVLGAVETVAVVADVRVALAAAFSLLLLALSVRIGRLVGRQDRFALGGSVLALATFAGNLAVATPLDPRWYPMLALQVSTVLAAGMVAVLLYRLLTRVHDRRVGLFAGLAGTLATPVGLWASIPKRHVLVTALLLAVLYALYRSREGSPREETRFRALAYALVAFLAWVHAPEAFVALLVLAAVDLPTARTNDPRTLALVGGCFCLALVPFLLTNALVVGNPVEPPRLWPNYDGQPLGPVEGGGGSGGSSDGSGGGSGGSTGGSGGSTNGSGGGGSAGPSGTPDPNGGGGVLGKVSVLTGLFASGFEAVADRPDRLYYTFVRGGYLPGVAAKDLGQAVNLTVLESAPLLGALCALPVALVARLRDGVDVDRRDPVVVADAFVLLLAGALTLVYIERLPLHAQVTVRYLLPLFALGTYGVARQPSVRRALAVHPRLVRWTALCGVLVGGQVVFAWLVLADASLGEALQFHAWVGLATGGALGASLLVASTGRRASRATAVCLGASLAAGAVLVLLGAFVHFAGSGVHAVPLARWLAAVLALG
ncbi:hypothetical protein [Halomarina ordinaria]|uniref:Glycosyltransferase RgtA/B/C/D-like domain-containing protein n=1 Tax=Halomarina ordinaria TaxID=3033939 RepID=A0ABD5U7B3_9EURY|nr:hypothetical protein [Halomarina sp. PSRA2]